MSVEKVRFDYMSQEKKQDTFKKIKSFKPTKFTMFQNGQNYIFTPYAPTDYAAIIILDDGAGNELHIDGCTCGYQGHGPHSTIEILKFLSFEEPAAIKLAWEHSAITFDIDSEMRYVPESIHSKVYLDESVVRNQNIQFNVPYKEVFVFHSEDNMLPILKILDAMDSEKMPLFSAEYYIGRDGSAKRNFNFPNSSFSFRNVELVKGPYFSINTERVVMTCFVSREFSVSVMNIIHRLVMGDRLFRDSLNELCVTDEEPIIHSKLSLIVRFLKSLYSKENCLEFYKQYRVGGDQKRGVCFRHEHPYIF